MLITKFTQVHV